MITRGHGDLLHLRRHARLAAGQAALLYSSKRPTEWCAAFEVVLGTMGPGMVAGCVPGAVVERLPRPRPAG